MWEVPSKRVFDSRNVLLLQSLFILNDSGPLAFILLLCNEAIGIEILWGLGLFLSIIQRTFNRHFIFIQLEVFQAIFRLLLVRRLPHFSLNKVSYNIKLSGTHTVFILIIMLWLSVKNEMVRKNYYNWTYFWIMFDGSTPHMWHAVNASSVSLPSAVKT